jgi:uncharacterized protein (TIGR00730 family)
MNTSIARIAVFCASSFGASPEFELAARELGALLAHHGIELVFGGTDSGLMGALARAVLNNGGRAIGVVPRSDEGLPIPPALSELIVVDSVAARKAKMLELSEASVALPGGLGTLDELFDALALRAIGVHEKPVALFNVGGFYDPLLAFLDGVVQMGFMKPKARALVWSENDAATLVSRLLSD